MSKEDDSTQQAADDTAKVNDSKPADQQTQQHDTQQQSQSSDHDETEALAIGWVPKDQFRGDPDKWTPAKEFLERGRNWVPFLRKENRRLEKRLERLVGQVSEKDEAIKKFAEFHEKTEKRMYDRALETLKTERKEALEKGDGARFEKADDDIKELEKAREQPAPKKTEEKKSADPEKARVFDEWRSENDWYGKNSRATGLVDGIAHDLAKEEPELVGKREFLDRVLAAAREEAPHLFGAKRGERAQKVEGANNGGQRRSNKRSAADLPDDARREGEKFVRQKLFKNLDAYAAEYFAE